MSENATPPVEEEEERRKKGAFWWWTRVHTIITAAVVAVALALTGAIWGLTGNDKGDVKADGPTPSTAAPTNPAKPTPSTSATPLFQPTEAPSYADTPGRTDILTNDGAFALPVDLKLPAETPTGSPTTEPTVVVVVNTPEPTGGTTGPTGNPTPTPTETTPPPVDNRPSALTGLTYSDVTGASARISWDAATDDNGITGYRISYTDGTTTNVITCPTTACDLTMLSDYTEYTVTVNAVDTAGQWGTSQTVVFRTADTVAPGAPANPTATPDEVTAVIAWDAATDVAPGSGVTKYVITAGTSTCTATAPATTCTLTGLDPFTTYTASIVAVDLAGNTSAPVTVDFKTKKLTPPGPASNVTATPDTTSAVVSWTAATGNLVTYDVAVTGPGGFTATQTGLTGTTATFTGLSSSTDYTVTVQATNGANPDPAAATGTFKTLNAAPVSGGAPKAVSPTQTSANVTWPAATDDATAQAALVYTVKQNGVQVASGPNLLSYSATGLDPNSNYSFEVTVTDSDGATTTLGTATVSTKDAAPQTSGAPSVSDSTPTTLTVSWPAATDDYTAAGDLIYKVTMDGVEVANGPGITSYTATGLTENSTHTFTVTVTDSAGQSTMLGITSGKTGNTAPTSSGGPSSSNVTADAATISWPAAYDNTTDAASLVYTVTMNGTQVASGAGMVSYDATGLMSGTSYTFTVTVADGNGGTTSLGSTTVVTL